MADTVRTIAALQTLLADGQPAGSITPQIVRDMLVSLDPLNANVAYSRLTSKPTTIAGWGITDYNSLGDARWLGLAGGTLTGAITNTEISTPATPSAGKSTIFANTRNARHVMSMLDSNATMHSFQLSLLEQRFCWAVANNATAGISTTGIAFSSAFGTSSSSPALSSSTAGQIAPRSRATSIAAASSPCGFNTSANEWFLSGASSFGGIDMGIRSGQDTDAASTRFFSGLLSGVAQTFITGGEPSASTVAKVGISLDSTDTNYQFIYNATGTASTKVDLGVARASGTYFDLFLYSRLGSGDLNYRVVNVNTGSVLASGNLTTNIPSDTTALAFMLIGYTVASTTALNVAFMKLVCLSEN